MVAYPVADVSGSSPLISSPYPVAKLTYDFIYGRR
jgi:hypothetical protein